MKRLTLLLCLVALIVPPAFAVGLCTDPANLGEDVLTPGFSCTLGPLLFQTFSASVGGFTPPFTPQVWLSAGVDPQSTEFADGRANLFFQTNFNRPLDWSRDRDVIFRFQVTSTMPVISVDGWLSGSGDRNIVENICRNSLCSGGIYNTLILTPVDSLGVVSVPQLTDFWVVKDISLHGTSETPATLSEFAQSFTVPEPLTLVLVGSGLLGLGLLRRRMRS